MGSWKFRHGIVAGDSVSPGFGRWHGRAALSAADMHTRFHAEFAAGPAVGNEIPTRPDFRQSHDFSQRQRVAIRARDLQVQT